MLYTLEYEFFAWLILVQRQLSKIRKPSLTDLFFFDLGRRAVIERAEMCVGTVKPKISLATFIVRARLPWAQGLSFHTNRHFPLLVSGGTK